MRWEAMRIILKNSLKNIFGKPFRTLLIVFAIFACSLCGYMCFDIGNTIGDLATSMVGSVSSADISVTSGGMDISEISEVLPESDILLISANSEIFYKNIKDEYNYASTTDLTIYGMDLQAAAKMRFLQGVNAGDGEILLNSAFAAEFGYKADDTIVLHDRAKNEVVLKVSAVLPKANKNPLLAGNKAVVNQKTGDILSCSEGAVSVALVDIRDNSRIAESERILKEKYPDATVSNMALDSDALQTIGELKAFLYLLFAILFLLVIFVTASISNRIVSERMPFIGTLRSLGMSARKTGFILILENVLYALLGSIPATLLYLPIRESLLLSMFSVESEQGSVAFDLPAISFLLPIGVVLGAVLVECLIPLRAILQALRTSIRDIIFDNRDTEYRFSKALTITGILFLLIALITFFLRTKLIFATVCLLCTVTSLALLFPVVLKFFSGLIGKAAEKTGSAAWSLASVETISRKSTVGSGVLLSTAAAMCVIIFSIAGSMSESMSHISFRCDAVITCSKPAKYYTYVDHLEGVTETEKYYSSMESITTDKDTTPFMSTIQGYPEGGYRLYENYEELPQRIENGTVYIDSRYAENAGYKVGDKITVTFRPESVLPITKEYTIAGIIHSSTLEGGKACLFLSEEEYKLILNDKPYYILVKCENPEKLVTMIKTYAADTVSSVTTYEEEVISATEEASQFTTIMGILIAAAIGMTCIGAVSNQLIGFTGRKKECAVMLFTAMSKKKLSGILFKEVLITCIVSAGLGALLGHILTIIIGDAIDHTASIGLLIQANAGRTLLFFLLLIVIFTMTVLLPIRNLRKMKISEQIKYE